MKGQKAFVVRKLALPGSVEIGLLLSKEREFLGIGEVSVSGVRLRDGTYPAIVRIDTPEGVLYPRLEMLSVEKVGKSGETNVRLRARGINWGQQSFYDEHEQPLITPKIAQEEASDELILSLCSQHLALGGKKWSGFSYSFRFKSERYAIYRLRFFSSWEIGGDIQGNVVLHQGQCNRPVYRGEKSSLFTTSCLKKIDSYGSPQGVSYQLGPRGGLLQGFDFQYSPEGALLMYWPHFSSISSLIESPCGSSNLFVVDEYRFPLSSKVLTAAKYVLFSLGPYRDEEMRDLWFEAYGHVHGGIRNQFGIGQTQVLPQLTHKYRCVLKKKGPQVLVAGQTVACQEMLYALADLVLPRLREQGVRRFFPEVITQSDVTELGMKRKLDSGVHGDLTCASVCATHRFMPAEFWGGMTAWRYFYEKGHKLELEIGHWWAPHLSPRSPILKSHPEYCVTSVLGQPTGAGYGKDTLNACNWNSGVYGWVKDDMRRWKEEGGLDFLFVDSWANLGLLQQNYGDGMKTNLAAFGKLFRDFRKFGLNHLIFEGVSPFGSTYFGIADLRQDRNLKLGGVVGQNDFDWWIGEEDMAVNLCMVIDPRGRSKVELKVHQFRAMANRGFLIFSNLFDDNHILPQWWSRLNHIYNRAQPDMQKRSILPEGKGIKWTNGNTDVIWVFKDHPCDEIESSSIARFEIERLIPLKRSERRILRAWNVYRIQSDHEK